MKKLKKVFILFLFLSISCNKDELKIDDQKLQTLPDNVESLNYVDSGNEYLNVFLENSKINKEELILDEVQLMKFKGNKGKFAFLIQMTEENKQDSRNLIVYFKDSDFTKYKANIHSVKTIKDKNNVEHKTLSITDYDKPESFKNKYEFIDGRLTIESVDENDVAKTGGVCVPPIFGQLDTNNDLRISRDEFQVFRQFVPISSYTFNSLDTNNDDVINQSEYTGVSCFGVCFDCLVLSCFSDPECGDTCGAIYIDCYAALAATCTYQCWG